MKKSALILLTAVVAVSTLILAACPPPIGPGGGDEIPLDPPKSALYIGAAATPESAAGTTLDSNLEWLRTNALDNTAYTIKLNASGSIDNIELNSYSHGKDNVSITLTTVGQAEVIIALKANGRLFTVGNWEGGYHITLTLGGSITLRGRSNNTSELVRVNKDAALGLTGNVKITGNNSGGGVQSEDGGTITMSGGKINGNNGAGVTLRNPGTTFTMSGGEISGNTAGDGSGVKVENGAAFIMSGTAVISGNNATWNGGGVKMRGSGTTFTMSGGTIRGNTAQEGGGVKVEDNAAFTMSGTAAVIDGNTSTNGGGGVRADRSTFTLSDGTISNNTANQGGGVNMGGSGSSFTMTGGTISGNTADNDHGFAGGGLYVFSKPGEVSTFSKTGGIIYGDTDNIHTPGSTENTATHNGGQGHAVWLYTLNGTDNQLRNTDAGPSVNMSWDGTTAEGFDDSTPWG
ncbi:hypothetical protein FACS189493_2150 [Spirochaetia bacterium]|nr:hypothetical protein FACS189493_2150 [Spirochaetia bacterium]